MPVCLRNVRLYCDGSVFKADVTLVGVSDTQTETGLAVTVNSCNPFCASIAIPAGGVVCPSGGTISLSTDSTNASCTPPPQTYDCIDGDCVANESGTGPYPDLATCEAECGVTCPALYTAGGTASNYQASGAQASASLSVAAPSGLGPVWMIVNVQAAFGAGAGFTSDPTVTFGGSPMTQIHHRVTTIPPSGKPTQWVGQWGAYVAAGASGDVVVTSPGATPGIEQATLLTVQFFTGLGTGLVDRKKINSSGVGGTPNAGISQALRQTCEAAAACVGYYTNGLLPPGSDPWKNGFTDGQSVEVDSFGGVPTYRLVLRDAYLLPLTTGDTFHAETTLARTLWCCAGVSLY